MIKERLNSCQICTGSFDSCSLRNGRAVSVVEDPHAFATWNNHSFDSVGIGKFSEFGETQ
jgi:hypothetical protein